MKTGWKWSFATLVILGLTILAQCLLAVGMFMYGLPLAEEEYRHAGANELPAISQLAVDIFVMQFLSGHCWFWIVPLALGWIWFEWKHQGENKAKIRIAAASTVSLAATLFLCLALIAAFVPFIFLARLFPAWQAEEMVYDQVEQASVSYALLNEAIDSQDWPQAGQHAQELENSFRYVGRGRLGVPMLTGLQGRENAEEIRRLTDEIAELSDEVHDSIRDGMTDLAPAVFERLQEAYEQLKVCAPGWPDDKPTGGSG